MTETGKPAKRPPRFARWTQGSSYNVIDFVLDVLSVIFAHH